MWKADFLSWKSKEDYVRAYKGDELVWDWSGLTFKVTVPKGASAYFSLSHAGTNKTTTKPDVEYSVNYQPWVKFTDRTPDLTNGAIVRMRGNNQRISSSSSNYTTITFNGNTSSTIVYGNVMSLIDKYNYNELDSIQSYSFYRLLYGNVQLTNANNLILPVTTMSQYCYAYMFYGCTNLVNAPELPAESLADSCYYYMFSRCSNLTTAPELPATTLYQSCYSNMFADCTNLKTVQHALQAKELPYFCYSSMFARCTSLATAPEIQATTCRYYCSQSMFSGCTSLTTAPELPATSIQQYSYSYMFYGCTSLKTAPSILPAYAGGSYRNCYASMFSGCTSLTTAPILPSNSVSNSGYASMFKGCTSLTTAPELPAINLNIASYESMFSGCTGLTSAPVLPAKELNYALTYSNMFAGCTNLSYINCQATAKYGYEQDNTLNWVSGVSPTGTFVKNPNATFVWPVGVYGIPEGWTVIDAEL